MMIHISQKSFQVLLLCITTLFDIYLVHIKNIALVSNKKKHLSILHLLKGSIHISLKYHEFLGHF